MKLIRGIEFCAGSREERLPDFAPDFPYIASRAEMDFYPERFVPWHWHSAVEVFYMESGSLEYSTPQGKAVFPQGSGGPAAWAAAVISASCSGRRWAAPPPSTAADGRVLLKMGRIGASLPGCIALK